MARKPISIRLSLFLYGFIPMIISTVLFSSVILVLTNRLIKQREETNLITNTRILSDLLDNELRKIKTISLNLAYSPSLRREMTDYEQIKEKESDPVSLYYGARSIQAVLLETVGPLKQVEQVNIILPDLEMICAGQYNLSQKLPEQLHSRIENIRTNGMAAYWSPPERDSLSEQMANNTNSQLYISYYQVLYDDFRNKIAYIEIKQKMETLFSSLEKNSQNFKVFNRQKLQIYPSIQPYGNAYSDILSEMIPFKIFKSENRFSRREEILCLGMSGEAPWSLINIRNEKDYLKPVQKILALLLSLIILISVLSFLISHKLSLGINKPLMNLSRKLDQMEWSRTPPDTILPDMTGITELNTLEVSFAEMNRKMDEKLDLFVAEKTLEVNARMLALQSQMDPHFLFNMLSIISIMAEEGQTEGIQKVISHLSRLIRYVSTIKELTVPVDQEIQMARHYMECISYRFGEAVEFTFVLPENLENLKIPKHSIIPLLENSIKYGMPENPPCRITLSMELDSENWCIKARDNGPGFSEDELEHLLLRIREGVQNPRKQLSNQISGMGLINICARYFLYYGSQYRFEARNLPEGGSQVILGGTRNGK